MEEKCTFTTMLAIIVGHLVGMFRVVSSESQYCLRNYECTHYLLTKLQDTKCSVTTSTQRILMMASGMCATTTVLKDSQMMKRKYTC